MPNSEGHSRSLIETGCSVHELIQVPAGYPKVSKKPIWLGTLKGSWYEIGKQYGEKVGSLARFVFDAPQCYPAILRRQGRKSLIEDLYRYEKRIKEWNPEHVDLVRGIGDGAAAELKNSKYADHLTNYEKALFLQCASPLFYRHPAHDERGTEEYFPIQIPKDSAYWLTSKDDQRVDKVLEGESAKLEENPWFSHDCTAILALPKATSSSKLMVAHNTQFGFGVGCYLAAFIVEPPKPAHKFWAITIPGIFLNNKMMNDKGVAICLHAGTGHKDCAFGVPWIFLITEAMSRASSMRDAVDIFTVGTGEYRNRTGRKTVLREGGLAWDVADENSACSVEVSAHYYAVRYPGEHGEKDFIVQSNHCYANYSIDENNNKTTIPIGERNGSIDDGKPGTSTRYWSGHWLGIYAHGRINEDWLQHEFLGSHVWYNKEGERTDFRWDDEKQMYLPVKFDERSSTICSHRGGYPESYFNEVPCPAVMVPADRKIYYISYKPEFWVGPWETVTLKET